MATTSPTVARLVLACLAEAGVEFALLHGRSRLLDNQPVSDIDVTIGIGSREALVLLGPVLEKADLSPVILWPYDVADTVTVLLSNHDATAGAQLDLLYDPGGVGKYGLRSGAALRTAAPSREWPELEPMAQLLYLIRKRHWKGENDRLGELVGLARREPPQVIRKTAFSLFHPVVARQITQVIGRFPDVDPPRRTIVYRLRRFVQRIARVRRPIGFWGELRGPAATEEVARRVASRFAAFLPSARVTHRPLSTAPTISWWVTTVLPNRMRPNLIVSLADGGRPLWPVPDLVVETEGLDADRIAALVVTAMAARLSL